MLKAAVSGAVGGISSFRGTSEARAETRRGVGESWEWGVGAWPNHLSLGSAGPAGTQLQLVETVRATPSSGASHKHRVGAGQRCGSR